MAWAEATGHAKALRWARGDTGLSGWMRMEKGGWLGQSCGTPRAGGGAMGATAAVTWTSRDAPQSAARLKGSLRCHGKMGMGASEEAIVLAPPEAMAPGTSVGVGEWMGSGQIWNMF